MHQRANPVERRVQEMKKLLRLFTKDQAPNKWDEQLHKVMLAMRKRRNEATGMTPAKIILGYEIPEYGEWTLPTLTENQDQPIDRETIVEQVNQNQASYKDRYAPGNVLPEIVFRPNQEVLVRTKEQRRDVFHCPWKGPFKVTKQVSPEVYEIDKNGILSHLHIDDIRPAPRGNRHESEDESDDSDSQVDQETEPSRARETEVNLRTQSQTDQRNLREDQEEGEADEPRAEPESEVRESEVEADLRATEPSGSQPDPTSRNPQPNTVPFKRRRRRVRLVIRDAPPPSKDE